MHTRWCWYSFGTRPAANAPTQHSAFARVQHLDLQLVYVAAAVVPGAPNCLLRYAADGPAAAAALAPGAINVADFGKIRQILKTGRAVLISRFKAGFGKRLPQLEAAAHT